MIAAPTPAAQTWLCTVHTVQYVWCVLYLLYDVLLSDSVNSSIIAIVKVHSAGLCQVSGASYSVKLKSLNLILCFLQFTLHTVKSINWFLSC